MHGNVAGASCHGRPAGGALRWVRDLLSQRSVSATGGVERHPPPNIFFLDLFRCCGCLGCVCCEADR